MGSSNHDLRKVKGHATQEDIDQGKSNPQDEEGNDASDELADEGVSTLYGQGLIRLSRWLNDTATIASSSKGSTR